MRILTLRRHRTSVPGRGITSLAEVPRDPHIKVLHLCRYPEKCGTVCGQSGARTIAPTHRAVVIDCDTTDLPAAIALVAVVDTIERILLNSPSRPISQRLDH